MADVMQQSELNESFSFFKNNLKNDETIPLSFWRIKSR